jgi:ADP-ribose pyrophosphatase YjhB (NUDIX family)
MKKQFTCGSFALIFDSESRILLCHRRDYDLWNLPGGGVEDNESPWEAVIREVKEEIGVDVEIVRLSGIYNKPDKNELCFAFICKIIHGELTLSDEADQIAYFRKTELPHNIVQKHIRRIIDGLSNGPAVFSDQFGKSSIELVRERKI